MFLHRGVECESVFDLPNHMMLDVASLLLSAAAIDRQDKDVSTRLIFACAVKPSNQDP